MAYEQVGVALHARHPGCVTQGRIHVGCRFALTRGPFATEDLGALAVVAVIEIDSLVHAFGVAIVVFVVR